MADAVFHHAFADLGATSAGLWILEAGRIRYIGGAGVDDNIPDRVLSFEIGAEMPAAQVIRTGKPVTYRSIAERNRTWPELIGVPGGSPVAAVLPLQVVDHTLGCLHIGFQDATEDGEAEKASRGLAFLSQMAELCAAALDRASLHDAERERQAFLLDASAAVANASGSEEALRQLARVAVPRLADLCLIDVADGTNGMRRIAAAHWDPQVADLVAELAERPPPQPYGQHPAAEAMAGRRSRWAADMPTRFLEATTRDARHLEVVRALHFTSYMCVPLLAANEALGVMTLVSAGSGRRFGVSDLALPEELASRVAAVVAVARREEREHELAHTLQQLLLPDRLPTIPGLQIAARYLTARGQDEAGGDFYDVVALPSGRLGMAIGDVEGHDAVAAATMGQLRSATRALAGQFREPSLLVDALRWSWDLLGFSRMATATFGRIDAASGDVVVSSAGHLPPILLSAAGRAALLAVDNAPPLGTPATSAATDTHLVIAPGDTLFFYTDGLVEERRSSIDSQLAGLVAAVEGSAGLPLEELCDRVVAGQAPVRQRGDDVAVLAVRRLRRGAGLKPGADR